MRPIKFRIWDNDKKEFIDTDFREIYVDVSDGLVREEVYDVCDPFIKTIPNAVVSQYTGFKDKNGVEIYEGDYLRAIDEDWGQVTEKVWFCGNGIIWGDVKGLHLADVMGCAQTEVVGNIYEAEKALADLAEIDAPLI